MLISINLYAILTCQFYFFVRQFFCKQSSAENAPEVNQDVWLITKGQALYSKEPYQISLWYMH